MSRHYRVGPRNTQVVHEIPDTPVTRANDRALERLRRSVAIEMTADDHVLVTLDGDNTVNDEQAFVAAITKIYERWPNLRRAVQAKREEQ